MTDSTLTMLVGIIEAILSFPEGGSQSCLTRKLREGRAAWVSLKHSHRACVVDSWKECEIHGDRDEAWPLYSWDRGCSPAQSQTQQTLVDDDNTYSSGWNPNGRGHSALPSNAQERLACSLRRHGCPGLPGLPGFQTSGLSGVPGEHSTLCTRPLCPRPRSPGWSSWFCCLLRPLQLWGVPPSPLTRGKSTLTLRVWIQLSAVPGALLQLPVAQAETKCYVWFQGWDHTRFLLQCP